MLRDFILGQLTQNGLEAAEILMEQQEIVYDKDEIQKGAHYVQQVFRIF